MEFNEFKDSIFSNWQKRLIKLALYGSITIVIFEVVIFLAFLKTNFLTTSVIHYLTIRILIPTGLNFLTVLICHKILKSNSFTVSQKNFAAGFSIFVVGSVVAIFHNYYKFLLVANGLPIIVTAIFADKKLLKKILLYCYLTFVIVMVVMWFDDTKLGIVDYLTTLICDFIFINIIYMVADTIVSYQSEQINFINTSNQRQTELIQELKIEPLTKLYNRTALAGALKSFVRKFNEGAIEPHMVLIDLDHFKVINDTYGHANGDSVLIRLSDVLKKNLGGIRRAFRYGGEEFVVLFDIESTAEVMEIMERIRIDFCGETYDFAPGENFTLSVGISKMQKNWDDTTWFNAADEALYRAKGNGRNRIELADF